MANNGHSWSEAETETLKKEYAKKLDDESLLAFAKRFGARLGLGHNAVRGKVMDMRRAETLSAPVNPSPYPQFNDPLVMEGDALVLPDIEFPFHYAEFINHVIELSQIWNVKQLILAGDVLHFDSLSGWESNWTKPNDGGLTAEAEKTLMDFAMSLPSKKQGELMEKIGNLGLKTEQDGISTELSVARRELRRIGALFDKVDFILGNHEGRFLRALQTAIDPQELLRLLEMGDKWRVAPYYFSYLDTVKGRFLIEHPKGAAESTAQNLAAKFHCHVIMGHSHALDFSWDISGEYYAIQSGCCVDEDRLPYAAQRHTTKRQHKAGAVLVVNGYPWLLHDGTDWERMKTLGG